MSLDLHQMVENIKESRKVDAKRFAELDEDRCQVCGAVGPDKRNLVIRCFYNLKEIIPEMIDLTDVEGPLKDQGYYLRVCKDCRGLFLGHLRLWWHQGSAKRGLPMDSDGVVEPPGRSYVPVRVDGRIQWLSEEEYTKRYGVAPVIVKEE